jgi:hypothetical protein
VGGAKGEVATVDEGTIRGAEIRVDRDDVEVNPSVRRWNLSSRACCDVS